MRSAKLAMTLLLELMGVDAEVAAPEGVPDVVGGVLEERQQFRVVEVLVAGVSDLRAGPFLESLEEGVQPGL